MRSNGCQMGADQDTRGESGVGCSGGAATSVGAVVGSAAGSWLDQETAGLRRKETTGVMSVRLHAGKPRGSTRPCCRVIAWAGREYEGHG